MDIKDVATRAFFEILLQVPVDIRNQIKRYRQQTAVCKL
jgi:hypothetical protein